MVECENKRSEGIPKRDFLNYPETWSFTVKHDAAGLVAYALGHDVKTGGIFEVVLRYRDKKWKLEKVKGLEGEEELGEEIENEMFREFAAHKARYLNAKRK
jgi:hypothetical protein